MHAMNTEKIKDKKQGHSHVETQQYRINALMPPFRFRTPIVLPHEKYMKKNVDVERKVGFCRVRDPNEVMLVG